MDLLSSSIRRFRIKVTLWSVLCGALALGSIYLGVSQGGVPATHLTFADEVLEEESHADEPERGVGAQAGEPPRVEAPIERAPASRGRFASGGAAIAGLGILACAILWVVGVLPLVVRHYLERARLREVESIAPLPKRRGSARDDAELAASEGPGDEGTPAARDDGDRLSDGGDGASERPTSAA